MQRDMVVVDNIQINEIAISDVRYLFEKIVDVFAFLSVSSIFIGGTGFFKTLLGYLMLGMNPSITVCSAVFLISFGVYTLDKIADMDKDITNMPERLKFLKGRKKLIKSYSIAAYIAAVALVFIDNPQSVLIVFIPLAANIIYGTRVHPKLPRLKDIPLMKNLVVASTWSLVTVMLPAMHLANPRSLTVALLAYFMLIKMFINTVLYDVRDVKGDILAGVRTIPVLMGTRKTTAILILLNSTLLPWLAFADNSIRPLAAILVIYGYAYILYFRVKRNPLALDFCVDGEWMLVTILLAIMSVFFPFN
jgi:4-hydroxybenzoate polyprenyltransferase